MVRGAYYNTSRENFKNNVNICIFFTELAKSSLPIMSNGGSAIAAKLSRGVRTAQITVMGVAKAALEASIRYLAVDLGKHNIR